MNNDVTTLDNSNDVAWFMGMIAVLIAVFIAISGCAPGSRITKEYEGRTQKYRFTATQTFDTTMVGPNKAQAVCKTITVNVDPQARLYLDDKPPMRLVFKDYDCQKPLDFEYARFLGKNGSHKQLTETEMERFFAQNERLWDEMMDWLWREGIIRRM